MDKSNGCMCIKLHQSKDSNSKLVAEVERLKQDIQQHIKWNEAHTKRIVELSEEVEKLKEYKAMYEGLCK